MLADKVQNPSYRNDDRKKRSNSIGFTVRWVWFYRYVRLVIVMIMMAHGDSC
jgi:hypothetical protein